MKLSNTSKAPPIPGIQFPESLTFAALFRADSVKSPKKLHNAKITPIKIWTFNDQ